jgi:hypothetical protein
MADNDSNIIKPVGSLQNIANLSPVRRREQGKRRNDQGEEEGEESRQEENGVVEEELDDALVENEDDLNSIDYRA